MAFRAIPTGLHVVLRSVNTDPVAITGLPRALPAGLPVVPRSVNPDSVAITGLPRALTTGHTAQGSLIPYGSREGVAFGAIAQEGTGVLPTGLPVVPRSVITDPVALTGLPRALPTGLSVVPWSVNPDPVAITGLPREP